VVEQVVRLLLGASDLIGVPRVVQVGGAHERVAPPRQDEKDGASRGEP
jgi:hypothetical protein